MKHFYEQSNVGHAKYVVNYHDGVQTHADGSPFYDIAIFSNRKKKEQFVRALGADGYRNKDRNWWTLKRLDRYGWLQYSRGLFVEDLQIIGHLLGSVLYERLTIGNLNYIRRVTG